LRGEREEVSCSTDRSKSSSEATDISSKDRSDTGDEKATQLRNINAMACDHRSEEEKGLLFVLYQNSYDITSPYLFNEMLA